MSISKKYWCKKGQTLTYVIKKDGVTTYSGSYTPSTWDNFVINKDLCTYTINPVPSDATVVLQCSDPTYTQEGNSISAPRGYTISWSVSKTEYVTQSNSVVLSNDTTNTVQLAIEPDDTDFKFTLNILSGSLTTSLPLDISSARAYDLDIYWGDTGHTNIPASSTDVNLLNHSYTTAGEYQIEIRSSANQMPNWTNNSPLLKSQLKSIDTNMLQMTQTSGYGLFTGCTALQTIHADTLKRNTQLTDCAEIFKGCSALTSIPADLFKYNTLIGTADTTGGHNSFNSAFEDCSALTALPIDLFKYNTSAKYFTSCFKNCSELATIPDNLFAYCPNVMSFEDAFYGCNKAVLNQNIFGSDPTIYQSSASLTFKNMFYRSSYTGTMVGIAPDIWIYSLPASTITEDCFAGDGNSTTSISNYIQIPMAWGGAGLLFSINPTPADATVVLTATGFTQVDNSIRVNYNTTVNWSVSKTNYVTQSGSLTVSDTETKSITLVEDTVTITINPTPADATVTLTATGYTQSGNSITVLKNTNVDWTVSKTDYITQSGSLVASTTQTIPVTLAVDGKTFTITPTPSDATVTLTASGWTQSGNSITVPVGTSVAWSVSKTNYVTQTGTQVVNDTLTLPITLAEDNVTITVNPTPSDATVTLTATGYTQVGNTITVLRGTMVTWQVNKEHYVSQSNSLTANADQTLDITLVAQNYTLGIAPDPSDATVTLTASGYVQSGNAITVPYNTSVAWSVSKAGYQTQSGNKTVTNDETMSITLVGNLVTLTISPTPSDATVTLTATGYTQSGNSISVAEGTEVAWSVSKTDYKSQSGTKTVNATETMTITLVALQDIDVTDYTYTLNDTVLTLNSYTGSATDVTVPNVSY